MPRRDPLFYSLENPACFISLTNLLMHPCLQPGQDSRQSGAGVAAQVAASRSLHVAAAAPAFIARGHFTCTHCIASAAPPGVAAHWPNCEERERGREAEGVRPSPETEREKGKEGERETFAWIAATRMNY